MYFSPAILASGAFLSGIAFAFAAPTPRRFDPSAGDGVVAREYNVPREMGAPHIDLAGRDLRILRRALTRLVGRGVAPSDVDFLFMRTTEQKNPHEANTAAQILTSEEHQHWLAKADAARDRGDMASMREYNRKADFALGEHNKTARKVEEYGISGSRHNPAQFEKGKKKAQEAAARIQEATGRQ